MKAPSKTCSLDPMPTHIVKSCLDVLSPVLTRMVNSSLQTGVFADDWKKALVSPRLKKEGLDTIFKNYRPVSNLPFVSKLTERAAARQVHSHMTRNKLYPSEQSSYRVNHSTETALLKVKNDILLSMNRQHATLLVLLDLSAAFDTVDHTVLLQRLRSKFGISRTALNWFSSYLSGRSQRVNINGTLSDRFMLECGVPQGSCLGPLLFIIYTSKLFEIVRSHLPQVHCYADDTQLYLSFKPDTFTCQTSALTAMESCIADIRKWMLNDKLMINDDKTEFIIVGTKQQLAKVSIEHIKIGNTEIKPSLKVRNLGSWFDSTLAMSVHITKLCSSAFYHLHNIRRIKKYLSRQTTETLVHAFVSSRIDYCNSLLYGLPTNQLQKIQRVQNAAARVVCGLPKFCHISPILKRLHWLPVIYRIRFKILLITFKVLHGLCPTYLENTITLCNNNRYSLRSSDATLLKPLPFKTLATLGDRSFQAAAPKLWNELPRAIRESNSLAIFKRSLKTHLFKLVFD